MRSLVFVALAPASACAAPAPRLVPACASAFTALLVTWIYREEAVAVDTKFGAPGTILRLSKRSNGVNSSCLNTSRLNSLIGSVVPSVITTPNSLPHAPGLIAEMVRLAGDGFDAARLRRTIFAARAFALATRTI